MHVYLLHPPCTRRLGYMEEWGRSVAARSLIFLAMIIRVVKISRDASRFWEERNACVRVQDSGW